jgi:energy-converting hydrogenase Eha subunit C
VPKKKLKKGKESKSIEVKVSLPITKVSMMSLLLAGLLTLMGYAGYLGVNSVWKFTHPQVNVSLDALKSLGYIARQVSIPAFPGPYLNNPNAPSDTAKASYLKAINEFEVEFRAEYPQSKLLNISDNELFNIGDAICSAKKESIAKSGDYSREEIINAFQAKFVLRYPGIEGLGMYIDAVGQRAFDHLCGGP